MPDDDLAGQPDAGMVETTASALRPEDLGRVVHVAHPALTGVLRLFEHGLDSPPLAGQPGRPALPGATRLVLEVPPSDRAAARGERIPVWLGPAARVVVDLRLDVGVCALCSQELLRTTEDCWHPHTVATACPPEPPLDQRPPDFRSGRPGRDHWRPRP